MKHLVFQLLQLLFFFVCFFFVFWKIQSKYIKSEIKNANGTLSVFKNHIKNELKDIYNEQGSYAMIGGNFVWYVF